MPRTIFKRLLPSAASIKNNRFIACLGSAIHDSEMWHLTKHSVAGAFFIGVFCAFLPIPFQTVLAAFLAIIFKRNLPLSVVLVFITNPLTFAPIFYMNYWVGSLFFENTMDYGQMPDSGFWNWLTANFDRIGKPLVIGSILCGGIAGLLSYFSIHLFWVLEVKRKWEQRKQRRLARGSLLKRRKRSID